MDVNYRIAWLRHTTFPPLTRRDVSRLERHLERPLPTQLAQFYVAHSNGIAMFSGELSVFGLQRHLRRELDYEQPFSLVREGSKVRAPAEHYFPFGSRDAHQQLLYSDERNGHVVAFSEGDVAPVSEWPDLWEMLLREAKRLRASFDESGRRLPYAELLEIT